MNPWLSQVNQKMFLARLLLEQQGLREDRHGHLELALCQSAVYQLECAYRHHLREVAAGYKCSEPESINTVEQLCAELKAIDKHPAEAAEMFNLEQQGSWLQQLLAVWQSFQQLPQSRTAEDTASPIPLMQVSAVQEQALPDLDVEQVQNWLAAMDELVERHRELMVEC